MTKLRPPLSPHRALDEVAGRIGWDVAARLVKRSETAIRNWSDPDTSAGVTLEAGLALDRAYVAAGGEGAPFFAWYQLELGILCSELVTSQRCGLEVLAEVATETGQAMAAQAHAARPGAGLADLAIAERETEEALLSLGKSLANIRARKEGVR